MPAKSFSEKELNEIIAKNDTEWEKRLLLMVMIMMIDMLSID